MKKNIFRLLTLFVISLMTISCSEEETVVDNTLEVTSINLHGKWMLQELDGAALPQGLYLYIDFNRNGTYKLYQNNESMLPVYKKGKFVIEFDRQIGYTISGNYEDNRLPNWNHDYIVTDLTKEGSMIWTVRDDKAANKEDLEVQKFVRVDEIPADILESGKYDQEDK